MSNAQDNGGRGIAPKIIVNDPRMSAGVKLEKANRPHNYSCSNCERWEEVTEKKGVCRRKPPAQQLVGMGEGLDRSPLPVTFPIYEFTTPDDVCAFHPKLLQAEMVAVALAILQAFDNRLTWDRDRGFSRAPNLEEARKFTPADNFDRQGGETG